MPGAGFTAPFLGKALSDMPALKPYRGKPAVRNFRGGMETSASFEARSAPSSYPTNVLARFRRGPWGTNPLGLLDIAC
jgi:hypothetical protein